MNSLPVSCPICGGEITITSLHCRSCESTIEGRFDSGPFGQLSSEQLKFVSIFVRCEGKISRMETEIGLSYPTIRNRLHEIIRAMGYEPGPIADPEGLTESERQGILEELDQGKISAEEAMQLLQKVED